MRPEEIEKYAFLYFCGKKDRDILNGKEKMTFEDLERFCYLTDLLGMQKYHVQIWNTFSGRFREIFEGLEQLYTEGTPEELPYEMSEEIRRREQWKQDFLGRISDRQKKSELKQYLP